jgi:glucosamine 6-phosphate synthetase-like amidotransferase/phosphosugar isomerase protein
MCGVFGFVNHNGGRPDLRTLERIALVTERRGPHAFGFAWIDSRGRLKMYKQAGRISQNLGLLSLARDARMLIGHCRYATQGTPANNANNHPHPADGGWIIHNGQIPHYRQLLEAFDLWPVSDCDSEVLGLLIEESRGSLFRRCREAARLASPTAEAGTLFGRSMPFAMLGLWARPARLVAIRKGNPLHASRVREGQYLASLAEGLPGAAHAVPDGAAVLFAGDKAELVRL